MFDNGCQSMVFARARSLYLGYTLEPAKVGVVPGRRGIIKYIEIVVDMVRPSYIMNPSRQGRSERNT